MSETTFGLPEDIKDFQYMPEGTRGTYSTGTTAVFAGQSPQLTFGSDLNSYLNYVGGSRDASEAVRAVQTLRLGIGFGTVVAATLTFLKRGVNLADGIETTFSGCLRETVGGTARYLKLRNCLIGAGQFGVVGSGPLQANVLLVANLEAYDDVTPTNWEFAEPTTGAYTGASGGASPVTIHDVDEDEDYTPSVRSWVVGFNNGIFPIPEVGITSFADFIPTTHGVNIALSINKRNLDIWAVHNAGHEVNTAITINDSPSVTFTGTGGVLDPADLSFMSDAPNFEVYTHKCLVSSLSTS